MPMTSTYRNTSFNTESLTLTSYLEYDDNNLTHNRCINKNFLRERHTRP